jgi:Domain of unknown function (DUF4249)
MKNYKIIFTALMLLVLSSCEKVINVDLKNAAPRIVIEGIVDNSGRPAKVIISKSVVFSAGNTYPGVSGAIVKITDNTGATFNLAETTTGVYTNATLIGAVGRTYNLSVTVEGKNYTASSTIPRQTPIDTLTQETKSLGGAPEKIVNLIFSDPLGFGDYNQVVISTNAKLDKRTIVFDDSFSDGSATPVQIDNPDKKFKTGDVVKIELRFIDKIVYRYLKGLADLKDGGTIPANPDTNISGNPLGYFSAHTSETKTIIIQ